MFDNMPSVLDMFRTGRLRALAVTTMARSDLLPDMPTVADTVQATSSAPGSALACPEKRPLKSSKSSNREIKGALAD